MWMFLLVVRLSHLVVLRQEGRCITWCRANHVLLTFGHEASDREPWLHLKTSWSFKVHVELELTIRVKTLNKKWRFRGYLWIFPRRSWKFKNCHEHKVTDDDTMFTSRLSINCLILTIKLIMCGARAARNSPLSIDFSRFGSKWKEIRIFMEILFTIAYRTESGNYMFHRSECLYIAQSSAVINVIASVLELSTRIIDINNWFYGGLCEWFHLESFDRRWEEVDDGKERWRRMRR